MVRNSFGLIPICKATGRTLLVQEKDSPMFLHFLRGFFRKHNICQILASSTRTEHIIIQEICEASESLRPALIQKHLQDRYSPDKVIKFLPNAVRRISDFKDSIMEEMKQATPKESCYWLWPKGGIEEGESPVECAIRETSEEAGILVPESKIIQPTDQLTVDINTFFGTTLRTSYFVADLPYEMESFGFDTSEIADVKWIPIAEAKKLMSPLFGSLIDKILLYFN